MFPDPTLRWRPYPSVMDGMKAPPSVLDRGLRKDILNLIVLECVPGTRAYRIEIKCLAYGAFDEMTYSIANHGGGTGMYGGGVYIKEAETSQLLTSLRNLHPLYAKARQFSFVGADFCYETIGLGEPTIHTFATPAQANEWVQPRETESDD